MAHYQEYLKDRSVGYTGCHQDEMAISDMYGGATSGWTVTCRGKVFLCSSSGHDETSCHERLP